MAKTATSTGISADRAIPEIVSRIVSRFHPVKIVLFGSHAAGTARPGSDVDLLVVLPVRPGHRRRAATEIDRALYDIDIPKDLIVVTPEDVAAGRPGTVIRPALRSGKVLYERAARRSGVSVDRQGRKRSADGGDFVI